MKERAGKQEPFAHVSLVDDCKYKPYEGTRLRKPVRIASMGANNVFSQDAALRLVELEDLAEASFLPATDIARLLARNPVEERDDRPMDGDGEEMDLTEKEKEAIVLRPQLRDEVAHSEPSSLTPVMSSW